MFHITYKTKQLIKAALKEDLGHGDVTTRALIPGPVSAEAVLLSKDRGVLAGNLVFEEVFRSLSPRVRFRWLTKEGSAISPDQRVCTVIGQLQVLLAAERVALNFISHLSGIATATSHYVKKTAGTKAKIYDTRKTMPLWRELQKEAVKAGGGMNHRAGLWDQALVKDNHWQFVKNSHAVQSAIKRLRHHRWMVEISKENVHELPSILEARPAVVLLDNFKPRELKRLVTFIRRHPNGKMLLEASGGITLQNVRQFAKTGVDRISIGALTHSAPAFDFSLEIASTHQ